MSIPDCIKTTLTLNEQALVDSFEKEGLSYENRRKRVEFEVVFNPCTLCLMQRSSGRDLLNP